MRILFLILVLANASFFAYGWFGPGAQASGDAQIIGQQLNPQKIRLLRPEQLSLLARKPEPKPGPAKAVNVCLEWGAFSGADSARAERALAALALGSKLTQHKQADVAGFWVYMGPLANRQLATQKAGELKRMGVNDYFIVPDDPKWRNAISLGIFKTEDAAKARLAALRAKGVRSAIIGPRETQTSKTYFQVHDADPDLKAKLNALKQDYAGSEVSECVAAEQKG